MQTCVFIPILSKDIIINYEPFHNELKSGDKVMIEMDNKEVDFAIYFNSAKKHKIKNQEINDWKILRICDKNDLKIIQENQELHDEYYKQTLNSIKTLELNMSLFGVQISFNKKMVLVTFTSESRVDFRKLVRTLASLFKKKIQLFQIGSRDRAKLLGGQGICGRELCCKSYLGTMPSVTMDAAREQNISFKGPECLSGVCEKLKCCLNYEFDQYKNLKKLFPKFGSISKIDGNEYVIIGTDILNKRLKLKSEFSYVTMSLDEYNGKMKIF